MSVQYKENVPNNQQKIENDNQYTKRTKKQKLTTAFAPIATTEFKTNDKNSNSLCTLKSESLDIRESCKIDVRPVITPFGDEECGEALKNQHLKLDFTTVEGIDDDILLQQKCIDFWEFITEHHELHNLKVSPIHLEEEDEEPITGSELSHTDVRYEPDVQKEEAAEPNSVYWVKEKDIMSHALATAVWKTCEIGSGDYDPSWRFAAGTRKPDDPELKAGLSRITPSTFVRVNTHCDDIDKLMWEMDQFDLMHPRTMSLPEHPPSLIKAKMCRIHPWFIQKQA